jgi:hypothetical protein
LRKQTSTEKGASQLIEQPEERVEELARGGHPTKTHKENLKALRDY